MTAGDPVRTLVIGEALVDAVTEASGRVVEHVGGSPANVAFGLASLAHPVDLATWIAEDERGRRIEAVCRERGVALTDGSRRARSTSVAQATIDASGAATYVFDLDWQLPPLADLTAYGHVHTGSIAAVLEPGGADVRATLERARSVGATVSYDPNARPSLMGEPPTPARSSRWRSRTPTSSSSATRTSRGSAPASPRGGPGGRATLGPSLVVVTSGGEGALVRVTSTAEVKAVPAPSVRVVDTVGAGDSFMAGLVSGLLDLGLLGGDTERQRLRCAPRGRLACRGPGAAHGALTVSVPARTHRRGATSPAPSERRSGRPAGRHMFHSRHTLGIALRGGQHRLPRTSATAFSVGHGAATRTRPTLTDAVGMT